MSASVYSLSSKIVLNNGIQMPRIHLGVYMTSGSETEQAVSYAAKAGYLAFDSAEWYANEKEVGSAINRFIKGQKTITREDLWFTTKLKTNSGYDATRKAIKKSIKQSGLEYIDLYLLHSPYGGKAKRRDCWRAVEDAIDDGEIKAGGVSNFGVKHVSPPGILHTIHVQAERHPEIQELLDAKPRILPAVNQIEVHPFNTQTAITSFCKKNDITIEAYAPLARALRTKHPRIVEMSKKYGVSWAQLMVRWSLQHGYVPLPKSVKEERIESNADITGFNIEEVDMRILDGLDEKLVTDWDPTDAD